MKKKNVLEQEPIRLGLKNNILKDCYYYLINTSWFNLFLTVFFIYILSNLVFAILYTFDPEGVLGNPNLSFQDAFFFSIQTMSTIGYGGILPETTYANFLVTLEAFLGAIGIAVNTGIVFSKLAKPSAKILFSDKMVLSKYDGQTCLSFRIGNARNTEIIEAKVMLNILVDEVTREGTSLRKIKDLSLVRSYSPFFKLTWSVFHPVDEESPLNQFDHNKSKIRAIAVTVTGHDSGFSNTVYARKTYSIDDIYPDRYFADIVSESETGRIQIDYRKFNDLKTV